MKFSGKFSEKLWRKFGDILITLWWNFENSLVNLWKRIIEILGKIWWHWEKFGAISENKIGEVPMKIWWNHENNLMKNVEKMLVKF